ncbi:MAG: hypothetical protein QW153_01755 [Candidatus Bilamarchaeaceae archaeon]
MRVVCLFILFLLNIIFSYADPPFFTVEKENFQIALLYNNSIDNYNYKKESLKIFSKDIEVSGTMYIAGFTPLVDNCTNGTMRVIVRKGAAMSHLWDNGLCDEKRKNGPSCDFDNDGCAEYEKEIIVNYSINGIFLLNEVNYSGVNNSGNILTMPEQLTPLIMNSSGNETLKVKLYGKITFIYVVNDQEMKNGICVANEKKYIHTMDFSDEYETYTCGAQKFFFLEKPILNEHWYREKEIEWLLFSQRKVYYIEIKENNENKAIFLYDFNVTKNRNNISEIETINKSDYFFVGRTMINGSTLSGNTNKFSYLYKINHRDDEALGKKRIEIKVRDVFMSENERAEEIYARQLSIGQKTETGTLPLWETTRKSFSFTEEDEQKIKLAFGVLGVFLIVWALISFKPKFT